MRKLHHIIAKRLLYKEPTTDRERKRLLPTIRLSMIGIGLGVAVILLSLFIVSGFKREIRSKISGFMGNLKIISSSNSYGSYTLPIDTPDSLLVMLRETLKSEVTPRSVLCTFVDQMAVVKTDSAYSGVVLHGVDGAYDTSFFSTHIVAGSLPHFGSAGESNEVLLSRRVASRLGLSVGEEVVAYFFDQERLRLRKLHVTGLFETGFEQYDSSIALADIRLVRGVLGWPENRSAGIEVQLPSDSFTPQAYEVLYNLLREYSQKHQTHYSLLTAEDTNPMIYSWLDLLDTNIALILGLMIAVAVLTMISGVIVVILEKVRTISTLKAIGQSNRSIRGIFEVVAFYIVMLGTLWGNVVALLLALLQRHFKLIKLDPSQYYMTSVPIEIDLPTLLLANVLVVGVLYLFVFIPTAIISSIKPSDGIRFE